MKLILAMTLVAGLTITNAFATSQAKKCDKNIITKDANCDILDGGEFCNQIKVYESEPILDYPVSESGKEQITKAFRKKNGSQKINICIIDDEVASAVLGK